MSHIATRLPDLRPADRAALERYLTEFDLGWQPGALDAAVARLPAHAPWRGLGVLELAKIDLERQWDRGDRPTADEYRRRFPDLGSADELRELERDLRAEATAAPSDTRPRADTRPLEPGHTVGRYRIVRELGRGGMGTVYLAHDPRLERDVALKIPSDELRRDPDATALVLKEARAAAGLTHPNICPVYDVGEVGGVPYFTCQFIDGEPLSAVAKRVPPLRPRRAAAVVAAVARAVGSAHRHGVIHRDLKPGNILLARDGRPVVMDFGLARRVPAGAEPHATMSNLAGSPGYMAPEQVAEARAGPASDQFSLGLVLYELLAGRPPFLTTSAVKVMDQLAREPVPPPSEFRNGIDPALEAACLRALAKRPDDRFPDMDAFADALDGERPPVATRRWRWVAVAAAVLVSAGTVAAVWLSWPKGEGRAGVTPIVIGDSSYRPAYETLPGFDEALLKGREFHGTPAPTTTAEWIGVLRNGITGVNDDTADNHLLAIEELGRRDARGAVGPIATLISAGRGSTHASIRREGAHALRFLGRDLGGGPHPDAVNALAARVADDLWMFTSRFNKAHPQHNPFAPWVAVVDPVYGGKGTALDALAALAPERVPAALEKAADARDPAAANKKQEESKEFQDRRTQVKLLKEWANGELKRRGLR